MNEQVERIIARIESLLSQKDFGFEDGGAEHGYKECLLDLKSFIRSMSEGHNDSLIDSHNDNVEPASEDLDKEINRYFNTWQNVLCDEDCCNEGGFCCVLNEEMNPVSLLHCRKIAKHFAEWQKQQMMKEAMECVVAEGGMCPAMESIPVLTHTDMIQLPKDKFKTGDKVKLIIIKE